MKLVYAIAICSLILFGCSQPSPDEQFERILGDFEIVLEKFDNITDYIRKDSGMNLGTGFLTVFKARSVVSRLIKFENDYPQNMYTDDAAYILAKLNMRGHGDYARGLREFVRDYPEAVLEKKTLDSFIMEPEKEIPLAKFIQLELSMQLRFLEKYDESNAKARKSMENIDAKTLSRVGRRWLSLGYYTMIENYESLGNSSKVKEICLEADSVLPGEIIDICPKEPKRPSNVTYGL